MIWYGSIISLTITCLCFSGERISLFIKPAINTRSVCRRIPRRCLVRCMHQRFCCKMFEKQATVSTQQCQRGARLAAYSISCFPAAFSRRFRYPNPSPQAFPFSLPAAGAALLPRPLPFRLHPSSLPFLRSGGSSSRASFPGSTTAGRSAVMAGRSLAEPSLRSATDDDVSAVPSTTTSAARGVSAQDEGPASGVLVECRICQEDGDEACMEAPCSCKGSLKYAHRRCIQRWCDEKGDTVCEICLQQFVPNYTASSKLFQRGRNTFFFSAPGYIQARPMQNADHSATSTGYGHDQTPDPTGVLCCRIIAIALMVLLVFRDAVSVFLGDQDAYTVAVVTLLMLRTAAIVIPVYIILVAVTELLHRRRHRQVCLDLFTKGHAARWPYMQFEAEA
ncbi:E3 ubiquitin-protein ligase MARCH8 [Zea mays]|uniref:E3 ubiquitin-protein ligase MARCH8 n=1 Tax=Zea mays TaxID=4577 RepID=A0A3L6E555_MAIZE|nr:E3 ubiquitin-protein ligase MARCH8 [Zea mays]